MYIVSNFEHTIKLETAITAIEMKGIPKEDILAVPLDRNNGGRKLFDTIHSSDSLSMLDVPMITGAVFALFGFIYGFVLSWGPIVWALIGTALGMGLGLFIKLYLKKQKDKQSGQAADVVLLIACKDTQAEMILDILWAYSALGAAKLDLSRKA